MSKKRETAQIIADIKELHLDLFGREKQQSSPGTGGRAWAKVTNAKGDVTEKVHEHLA